MKPIKRCHTPVFACDANVYLDTKGIICPMVVEYPGGDIIFWVARKGVKMTQNQKVRFEKIKRCPSFDEAFKWIYEWIKEGVIDFEESNRLVRKVTGHGIFQNETHH